MKALWYCRWFNLLYFHLVKVK